MLRHHLALRRSLRRGPQKGRELMVFGLALMALQLLLEGLLFLELDQLLHQKLRSRRSRYLLR